MIQALAAHGGGGEERWAGGDGVGGVGDHAAGRVEADQGGVAELADEPAVIEPDQVEGGLAGVPPGDHRRAGQVDDGDLPVAAERDVRGVAVGAETDAVWGGTDFDAGADAEGRVGFGGRVGFCTRPRQSSRGGQEKDSSSHARGPVEG